MTGPAKPGTDSYSRPEPPEYLVPGVVLEMRPPPDEFRRRIYVRLPFADRYLAGGKDTEKAKEDIRKAFEKPLFRVRIR